MQDLQIQKDKRMAIKMTLRPSLEVKALPNHSYTVNGFPAPSISEICSIVKPYIPNSNDALSFGQQVHAAIHFDLEGDLLEDSVSPAVLGCVNASRAFADKHKLIAVAVEHPVGSIDPLCAGRIDVLFMDLHGEYWLPDWKTGGEYNDYQIRMAGYEWCFRQTYLRKSIRRMAVYLGTDGTFKERPFDDPFHIAVFRACHQIWSWKQINDRGK